MDVLYAVYYILETSRDWREWKGFVKISTCSIFHVYLFLESLEQQ